MVKMVLIFISTFAVSCGGKKSKVEKADEQNSFDATGVSIELIVPDRSTYEAPEIEALIEGYFLKFSPVKETCSGPDVQDTEFYPEDGFIKVLLDKACEYTIKLAIGRLSPVEDDGSGDDKKVEPEAEGDGPKVFFDTDIKPLIDSHCISCHQPGGEKADIDFTNYETIKARSNAIVSVVVAGSMPKSAPLSDEDKKKFSDWQTNNFLYSASGETGPALKEGMALTNEFNVNGGLTEVYYSTPSGLKINPEVLAGGDLEFVLPFRLLAKGREKGFKNTFEGDERFTLGVVDNPSYQGVIQGIVQEKCAGCHTSETDVGGMDLTTFHQVILFRYEILDQVEQGGMPKDASLSDEEIMAFESWADHGFPEFQKSAQ